MDTSKYAVPIAIVIAGAIIGGSLYLSAGKSLPQVKGATNTANVAGGDVTGAMKPVTADDHILGNPNADLVIVEYSDTECPFCKMFHSTLQRIVDEYGKDGKVAWVYRHMPLSQLHSRAPKEAEATECAYDQGGDAKFWQFTNMVYSRTNSNNSLDPAELPKIAKDVGLNVDQFNTCLSSGKFKSKVDADYNDGLSAINNPSKIGTPYSVIISKDGVRTPIAGAYPYDQLKPIIDTLLSK
jgi:protein-disulfide isomerase